MSKDSTAAENPHDVLNLFKNLGSTFYDWRHLADFNLDNSIVLDHHFFFRVAHKAMLKLAITTNQTVYKKQFTYHASYHEELRKLNSFVVLEESEFSKILTSKDTIISIINEVDRVFVDIISLSKNDIEHFEKSAEK